MYFLETTVLHCRPPNNLAQKYEAYSVYPASISEDEAGILVIEVNDSTFGTITIGKSALYISTHSDEYILCIAAGTLILATLEKIISGIPDEVTFLADLDPFPNTI